LFVAGNDFLQVNSQRGETFAGTRVDTDTRYAKIFRTARKMLCAGLDRLAEIAPIEVLVIPGNHDTESMFHLGEVLEAWYRLTDRVTIDNRPPKRKYKEFGKTLLGFTHGGRDGPKFQDLPLLMAQEMPEAWERTKGGNRIWRTGHIHKRKEARYTAGDTFNGVEVTICPSLCAADGWHSDHGWINNQRASQAYLYEYEDGFRAMFSTPVGLAEDI
jgi:hypothetical protein